MSKFIQFINKIAAVNPGTNNELKNKFLIAMHLPILAILITGISFFTEIYGEYKFTKSEILAVKDVRLVFMAMIKLQEIRGLHYLALKSPSDTAKDFKIDEIQIQLEKQFVHEYSDHQDDYSQDFRIHERIRELNKKNKELHEQAMKAQDKDAEIVFKNYTDLIFEYRILLFNLARGANLILDPELENNTLVSLLIDRIPGSTEKLGRFRDHIISNYKPEHKEKHLNEIKLLREQNQEQINHLIILTHLLKELKLHTLHDEMNTRLVRVKHYIDNTDEMNFPRKPKELQLKYFSDITAQISSLSLIHEQAGRELINLLQKRLDSYFYRLFFTLTITVLGSSFMILYIFIFFISIKNAFKTENNLRNDLIQSGLSLKTIIDTMVDGLITIDAAGNILSINKAAENIFQYRPDEVLGKNVNMLMPEPYKSSHDQYLKNYHKTGIKKIIGIGREVIGLRKDGSEFPLDLAVSEMILNNEIIYSGIVRDITENKRIDKMKNEFISTVSHELRTPLTSIRGSIGLIRGGIAGELPEKAKDLLQIANNNTERLLLLINDILDIQKIESGQMAFKFQNISLITFLEHAVREHENYGSQYDVKFQLNNKIDDARIFADKDRLMQVMANLLSNAAKFSPPGDTVVVNLARHGSLIRISVSDHGPGIPADFQPRVFEKFTQSDSSDTKKKGGTGLGLSIAKIIVEKHGGHIGFVTHESIGTTFFIEFPVMKESEEPDVPPSILIQDTPCILIIEDDPDIAGLLRKILAECGYNSDIAYDTEQAEKLLEKNNNHYKCITLDLILPGEDGISFMKKLRNHPEYRAIPVIVVSITADETRRIINGGAVNVVDWLQKPIDQKRLIESVRNAAEPGRIPRILHVEDEEDIHRIVKEILQNHCNLVWTSTLRAGKDALYSDNFDLVLLDIGLPDGSGLDLLEDIERRIIPPRVVIFSAQDIASDYANRVNAVLLKSKTDQEKLEKAISQIMKK